MIKSRFSMVGIIALGFANLAVAQPDAPLKGPDVKDNGVPGQKRTFGEGEQGRKAQGERPLPLTIVNKALDVLRGDAAGDNKLSADQESKIKAAIEEFQTSTRAFFEKNKDQIVTLREQVAPAERARIDRLLREATPAARGKGAKKSKDAEPAMADPMDSGEKMDSSGKPADVQASAKARDQLLELLKSRPKPEDAQAKIWANLTDAQKPLAEKELARLREQAQKAAAKPGEKGGQDALLEELKNKTPEEIMNDPRVPERLRERLRNMTPEQREQAIKRLRERGAEGLRGRRDAADKPAPSSDDVQVPSQPK